MKKLTTIVGVFALASLLAVPVFAHRGGWGGWTHGPGGDCWRGPEGYGDLTEDQRTEMDALEQKFFGDTSQLRKELWAKTDELDFALSSSDPDPDKAKALQNEISELRAKLAEKRLDLELEARKIAPEGYGRRLGRGYGRQMKGGGWNRYGNRSGSCCN
jgi:zinc resistance-associated protein